MKIENSTIFSDVLIFTPIVHKDHRGCFFESFNGYISNSLKVDFLQENYSISAKNVLRGLHYQWEKPNGKLIRCTNGSLIDFVVDIRKDSPTFGKYDFFHLESTEPKFIWIPPHFAHGFLTLEDNTHLTYKCTSTYNKQGESSINPFDSDINLKFDLKPSEIIISDRDKFAQSLSDYLKDPKF